MPDVTYDIPKDDKQGLANLIRDLRKDFDNPADWYRAIAIFLCTNFLLCAMRVRGIVDPNESMELAAHMTSLIHELGYLVRTEYDDEAFGASVRASIDAMIRENPGRFVYIDDADDNDPSKYRN